LAGISRVGKTDDLRLFPLLPMQTLEHLYKLQPDQDMLVWLISYNQNGRFSAKLAADRDAYKQRPKKKPAATTSHQPTSGTEQNQGSGKNAGEKNCSTSIPSKNNTDSTQQLPNSNSASAGQSSATYSANVTRRIVGTFRLCCIGPNVPARQFRSFSVVGDGNCLFASVCNLLGLNVPINRTRTRVVQYLSDCEPSLQRSALNEHMM
jgi:hypothetical protein